MFADNEVFPENRVRGIQDIFRRSRVTAIHDGIRAGEQGRSTLMDSTQCSVSKRVQTNGIWSSSGRPDDARNNSFYGNIVCGRYRPLHVERRSSRPRRALGTDPTRTDSMEHSTQRNGRSTQTRKMLLVHARLHVRGRGMVIR